MSNLRAKQVNESTRESVFRVSELDCAEEVRVLRRQLEGRDGVASLDFRIFNHGELLLERELKGRGRIRNFFDGRVIDLDALIFGTDRPDQPELLDLDLAIAMEVGLRHWGSSFSASFAAGLSSAQEVRTAQGTTAVLTPEPGTALLLGLGLAWLAALGRGARR